MGSMRLNKYVHLGQTRYCGRNRSIEAVMNGKSDRPCLLPKLKTQILHTLLSVVLFLAARSLILMLLPLLINRTKFYFFSCVFFLSFIRFFNDFWSNFFKKVTSSDFLRKKVTMTKWQPWQLGHIRILPIRRSKSRWRGGEAGKIFLYFTWPSVETFQFLSCGIRIWYLKLR